MFPLLSRMNPARGRADSFAIKSAGAELSTLPRLGNPWLKKFRILIRLSFTGVIN